MGDEATQQYAKVDPKTGQMEPPADRPTGVTILAMLYFIMAGVTVVQILVTIVWGLVEFEWGVVCCAVPFFLVALFYFMIGTGLFLMMKWAWFWALLLAIFGMLFAIGNLFSTWYYSEWYVDGVPAYLYAIPVVQIIFNGLILLYLFKMKDFFREVDPKQMQQMQVQMMEKQLQQMKKQQGEEPKKESTEDEHKESGGDESEGGDE
ncbi:MAG: hypothetical protein KAJ35_01530 [Thermoplasmata archaeon]|nr:hypothetical protein [Thermoplasmata archaeon]